MTATMTATDVEWTLALLLILVALATLFAIGIWMMDADVRQQQREWNERHPTSE